MTFILLDSKGGADMQTISIDDKYLELDESVIVIQVNGKRRGEIKINSAEADNKEKIESQAREIIISYLENTEIKRVIHVPGKIVNFVV